MADYIYTMSETAKPKGRKRLTDEERAARAEAAEERKRIAAEKKAAKALEAENKRLLKAAINDLKREQAELRALAAKEENEKKCEIIRQYVARMRILREKKSAAIDLRQSTAFNKPIGLGAGALRSPPGNDVIYEDTVGMPRGAESDGETDSEREDESGGLEEVDWDEIELPTPN